MIASGANLGGQPPAEVPVCEGARRTIRKRVRAVRRCAADVAGRPAGDAEPVHALRIACRRAEAAVRAFEGLLPERKANSVRRALRDVRRSAAEARRADVHLALFRGLAAGREGADLAGAAFVLGAVEAERERAYAALAEDGTLRRAVRRLRPRRLAREVREPRGGARGSTGSIARDSAHRALDAVVEASRADLADPARLHELRISIKGLRYTLDLFEDCYDAAAFEGVSRRLGALQGLMGEANDLVEMLGRTRMLAAADALPEPIAGALAALGDEVAARQAAAAERLREHWAEHGGAILTDIGAMLDAGPAEGDAVPGVEPDAEPALRFHAEAPDAEGAGEHGGAIAHEPIGRIEPTPTGSDR